MLSFFLFSVFHRKGSVFFGFPLVLGVASDVRPSEPSNGNSSPSAFGFRGVTLFGVPTKIAKNGPT